MLQHRTCTASPQEIADKVVELTNGGKTAREFFAWIGGRGDFDKRWAELLFATVSLATMAAYQWEQNKVVDEFLPYLELSCLTRFCKSHAGLDGLVRRSDDPIWEDIYPPNGWLCGCSVLSTSSWEEFSAPEVEVSEDIRRRCREWLDSDPNEAIRML